VAVFTDMAANAEVTAVHPFRVNGRLLSLAIF